MHVRICRNCGEEFRPEIARCSDCGGVLEDRYEHEGAANGGTGPPDPLAQTGPVDTRPLARAADVRDLVPLAEALRAAGIACHITQREAKEEGRVGGFDLGVRDGERLAAMTVLEFVPGYDVARLELKAAPPSDVVEGTCPACGDPVPEGVTECLECGLAVGPNPGSEPSPS